MGFQGWTNQLVDVLATKGLLDQLVMDLEGLAGRGTCRYLRGTGPDQGRELVVAGSLLCPSHGSAFGTERLDQLAIDLKVSRVG